MVSRFIRDSLEFWVREYNVDGFRFDLMGIFHTDEVRKWGEYLNQKYPARNLLIYGELWNGMSGDDFAVKLFPANRALVNSGKVGGFNADFRELIKGGCDDNTTGFVQNWQDNSKGKAADDYFLKGIIGSLKANKTVESLYNGGWSQWNNWSALDPDQSINYAFAHDNYCAYDKVSLPRPNGTYWDAGYRTAQVKFSHAMVLTAQGLPFLHAGDEMLRTKKLAGETLPYEPVRNTYMWGTDRNKMDWSLRSTNATLVNYHRDLIALRKQRPGFRLTTWDDVTSRVKVTLQPGTGLVATVEIDEDNNLGNGYELLAVYNSGNDWTLTWPGWTKIFDGNGFNCAANKVCKGTEMTVFTK
jgi:pullulanase